MELSVPRRCWRARLNEKIVIFVSIIFVILFTLEKLLHRESVVHQSESPDNVKSSTTPTKIPFLFHVEIYSQSYEGEYLWNHLIEGKKELQEDGVTNLGKKIIEGIDLAYTSGSSEITPHSINSNSAFVLVIDGSTLSKQNKAEMWINQVLQLNTPSKLFLVLYGNQVCSNQWITDLISANGGPVSAVFIIRDSTIINISSEVYWWPLGVATYLEFPLFFSNEIDILSERPYICNFIGNIQPNSTLEIIPKLFKMLELESSCYLKTRNKPITSADRVSLGEYVQTLSDSDLTLCPIDEFGNPETHCIYEALSLGSVPVVEDVTSCDDNPLGQLKEHNPPVILVKSLEHELSGVIADEKRKSLQEKIARRATVVNWYSDFRHRMAKQFIHVINSHMSRR